MIENIKMPCLYAEKCAEKDPSNKDCRNSCIEYQSLSSSIMNSGKPDYNAYLVKIRARKCDIDALKKIAEIKENIDNFVHDGKNLYIHSKKIQNGKTTLAVKLMYSYFHTQNSYIHERPCAYYIDVPDFLLKTKNFEYINSKEFRELDDILINSHLIIWDDIATYPLSQKEQTLLQNYISKRFNVKKSNIFIGTDNDNTIKELGRLYQYVTLSNENIELFAEGNKEGDR